MVTPVEEPQEEENDVIVSEMEVEEVSVSAPLKKSDSSFDFSVEDVADRPGLVVYTVSTKPSGEDWKELTILAPNYGAALEMAGISKANTVKVSEVIFEG